MLSDNCREQRISPLAIVIANSEVAHSAAERPNLELQILLSSSAVAESRASDPSSTSRYTGWVITLIRRCRWDKEMDHVVDMFDMLTRT
jgi:hypothetical protein